MNIPPFEPVTDPEVLRRAAPMLALGNVAVHRGQALNQSPGIPNHCSIAGRIACDRDQGDDGSAVEVEGGQHA